MTNEMPEPPVAAQIISVQERQREARDRVLAAAAAQREDLPGLLHAALMELAKHWREEAAHFEASGRRGAKTTAKEFIQAAARLSGFAIGLAGHVVITEDAPASVEPALTSDNFVPVLESRHHEGDGGGLVIVDDPIPAAPVTIPSPFVSPAPVASLRPRAPVQRLSFGDLKRVASETYPTPRPHLSHSYVESLESCGLKAMLSDASRNEVIGPRRPSWALIGGTAFHACVEQIELAALALGGATPDGELDSWEEVWNKAFDAALDETNLALAGTAYADTSTWHVPNRGLEGYDWWRVKGPEMLKLYTQRHDLAWRAAHTLLRVPVDPTQPNSAAVPALELAFSAAAGSTAIRTEGRLDIAWMAYPGALPSQYPTATLEIVDFKSGRNDPTDTFQLVQYADILRRVYLPTNFALPIVGRHYLARKGIYTDPVSLDTQTGRDEIDYRFSTADRAMRSGVFTASPSSFCAGCGLVDYCPTQRHRDPVS